MIYDLRFMNIKYMTPKGVSSWFKRTRKLRKILFVFSLIVIIVILPIAYLTLRDPSMVLADTLVKLDEGYGESVGDQQGNVTGTITNAVWKTDDLCFDGKCLYFDGTGDLVSFGDDVDLDFTGSQSFTITLWFRHTPMTSGQQVLVAKYNSATGTDGGYKILMESDGDITFGIDDDQTSFPEDSVTSTAANYDDNQWHQVEAVKSGSSSISLYIDANLIGTTSLTSTGNVDNSDTFYLGMDGDGSSNGWVGFLDELKVYRLARSASGIKGDFAKNSPSGGTSASFGISDSSYLSNGLVGYWRLDENSGTTTGDSSGNGITSQTFTGQTTWTTGKFGPSLTFDGTDDVVRFTEVAPVDLGATTDSYSISAWINTTTFVGFEAAIAMKNDSSSGAYPYFLNLNNGSDACFKLSDGTNTPTACYAPNVNDGVWHHIVGVRDVTGDKVFIYVDGIQAGSVTDTTTATTANNDDVSLGNGGSAAYGLYDYTGKIDDVRIYNRAMSSAEIEKLYSWGPAPIAYYQLDENTGTSANDTSGSLEFGGAGIDTLTLASGASWTTAKFGSGVRVGQSSDAITTTQNTITDIKGENLTIEGWFYREDTDNDLLLIRKKANALDTGAGYALLAWSNPNDGNICLYVADGTDKYETCTAFTRLTANTWYHIAAVFDRDSTTNTAVYINGVKDKTSEAGTISSVDSMTNTQLFSIMGGASSPFNVNSRVDDVKVYAYARNSTQLITDMNAGQPSPGSPVGSYVARWKMDDEYGTTAQDTTTNNNDLTLNSSSWTPSGKFNGAWNGTGANWLSKTDDPDFDFNTAEDFSLSLWFKSDSLTNPSNDEYLVSKEAASAGYAIWATATNAEIVCGIDDDATTFPEDSAGDTAANTDYYDQTWHHAVCIRNTTTGRLELYIDAKLVDADATLTATGNLSNTDSLTIGDRNATNDTDDFNGDLDEVKIFRSALFSSEVKVDMNYGSSAVLGDITGYDDGGLGGNPPNGWWRLSEGTGTTTVSDSSGGENNMTMNNIEETDWSKSMYLNKSSSVLTLDGSNEYLSWADDSEFDVADDQGFTIMAWVKHNGAISTSNDYIMTKADTTNGGYKLYMDDSGDFCFATDDDTTWTPDAFACTSGIDYDDSLWHHVVGKRDTSEGLKLFVDGRVVASGGAALATLTNANALYIGMDRDGTSDGWDGTIDDVRFYNYTLTDAQTVYTYNRGAPWAWYKLDECSGTTAYNSAINSSGEAFGLNGTISAGSGGSNTSVGSCSSGTTTEMWNNGTTGKRNASLDFDGDATAANADYVDMGDQSQFNIVDSGFSVEAWVNRATFNTLDVIASKKDDISSTLIDGWALYINVGDLSVFNVGNGSVGDIVNSSGITITAAGWHHIVGVWDNDIGQIFVYVDGIVTAGSTVGSLPSDPAVSFQIGSESDEGNPFDGQIDNVRIYSYPLSQAQVKKAYNEGAVFFGSATGPP